jgi:hypothetical protein
MGGRLLTWNGVQVTNFSSQLNNIGLYVSTGIVANNLWVGYDIAFHSDARIKKDIIDIDDGEALAILRLIEPKKYKYKDSTRPTGEVIGFIAQQIRDVLPHAHKYSLETLPNIQQVGVVIDDIITTNTDMVFEYDDQGNLFSTIVVYGETFDNPTKIQFEIIDARSIRFTGELPPLRVINYVSCVYIQGQEVNNFNTVKKDVIFTVSVAALQEVDRQLQSEKEKTILLESRLASLEARMMAAGL